MKNHEINLAIKNLKKHRKRLTCQQFKTIKGQIIAGDSAGAMKGLRKILQREEGNNHEKSQLKQIR